MGIFRHDLTSPGRVPEMVCDDEPRVSEDPWVACDRCRVAQAQVEVITDAGPVFLCQHHHNEHRDSIVAAGYLTHAWPGSSSCS